MAKQDAGEQQENNQEQLKIVTDNKAHLTVAKSDLTVEIETQLTKKLTQVGIWVVTSVLAVILGSVIGSLYTLNGKINELSGKYSSPDNLIQHIGTRIEKLESENKELTEKLYQKEIEELRNEINKLSKKDNHGN